MRVVLPAALLWLGPGCETVEEHSLTHKLWTTDEWRHWSEPAPEPKLALFQAPEHADVLVCYEALQDNDRAPHRQAYFLNANQDRLQAGRKPRMVNPKQTRGLTPIPVVPPGTPTGGLTNYAMTTTTSRRFVLFDPEEPPTPCDLPLYPAESGTSVRVALTPLAVTGDTVMVGLVASFFGALLWLEAGAPGVNGR